MICLKMKSILLALVAVTVCSRIAQGVSPRDLYSYINEPSDVLPRGDEEYAEIQLDVPAHFYSEKYEFVYVSETFQEIDPQKEASEEKGSLCMVINFYGVTEFR